jgi:hypothetical protein
MVIHGALGIESLDRLNTGVIPVEAKFSRKNVLYSWMPTGDLENQAHKLLGPDAYLFVVPLEPLPLRPGEKIYRMMDIGPIVIGDLFKTPKELFQEIEAKMWELNEIDFNALTPAALDRVTEISKLNESKYRALYATHDLAGAFEMRKEFLYNMRKAAVAARESKTAVLR